MDNIYNSIENSLILEITNPNDEGIASYWRCEQALNSFLLGNISFQDYIDILSSNEVGIDEYLSVIDSNLSLNGI